MYEWMTRPEVFVAGAVGALGVILILALLVALRRLDRRLRARLSQVDQVLPIDTEAPIGEAVAQAKARGLASLRAQFTVSRRTILPAAVLLTVLVACLPLLDQAPAAVLSVIVGGLTVLMGIAARPYLENLIAGLVISFSRVVSIGDTIKMDDWYGTIEDITSTHTTIKLWDWRRYVLPNSEMLRRSFASYSLFDDHIWACVEFWVEPGADLRQVETIAVNAARASSAFNPVEPPSFWVFGLDKDAVHCWVAAWTTSAAEAWTLRSETGVALIEGLREAGIATQAFQVVGGAPAARA